MIDEAWLGTWFQPQHLDAAAVTRRRAEFEGHPARLLVLTDLFRDPVAARLHRFLADDVEWTLRHQLERDRGSGRPTPREVWDAAPEVERFFRYAVGEMPAGKLTAGAAEAIRFTTALRDARMAAYFEAMTGMNLGATTFTFHAMSAGDFLRPHDDDSHARRLAFVAYLMPDWRPEYGGNLGILDRQGRSTEVPPAYNSLVVFDVTAHEAHWVDPIRPAAGAVRRLSIGGWFGA